MSMNPEELAMMQQQMAGQEQGIAPETDPNMMMGAQLNQPVPNMNPPFPEEGVPMEPPAQADATMEPMDILPEMINQYMDYAIQTKNNAQLNEQVKAQIMVQMAQAINYLVPLIPNDQEMQMKQAELQMKFQEQQMQMEMKQQEHQMDLQFKQEEMQLKMQESQIKAQATAQQTQQKIIQNEQTHQQKIVQTKESHKQQMEQQKQASQLKQTQKPTSKEGK